MIDIITRMDVSKISDSIELITGIKPTETITEEKYVLKLGSIDPLVIGYDKKRKLLTEENMSRCAHIKMLEELSQMMKEEAEFLIWVHNNKH